MNQLLDIGVGDPRRAAAFRERLATVRALLDARAARGVLFASRRDFAWLTCGGTNHVVLESETGAAPILVTRDEAVVLAPVNEAARIRDEEVAGLDAEVASLPWHEDGAAVREAARRAGGEFLDDGALEEALVVERSILGDLEHDRMRWLGQEVERVAAGSLGAVAPGDREDDLAASVTAALARDGIRTPVLLVAADERIGRYRHPLPTDRAVRRRVMLVLVAERWGLHVALTRFREIEPPDTELARRLDASASVLRALTNATAAGSTLGDVLAAGLRAYGDLGFPQEWTLHHQGGTIGYQGRERIAVPGDATVIRAGMAFAWNPSVSGAKAEETFLLGAGDVREPIARG